MLKSRGCGKVMLHAIQAVYACIKNVLRSVTVEATVGVSQGAPSFHYIHMDQVVRIIKRNIDRMDF